MQDKELLSFSAIKQRVTVFQILNHYGLLKGIRIKSASPFYPDRSGLSFSVTPSGRGWAEFKGGSVDESGDVVDFVAKREGVSKKRAGELIVQWFSLEEELEVPTGYLSEKRDALRALIGKHPEAEKLFMETIKESHTNGRERAEWEARYALQFHSMFLGLAK